MKNVFLGKRLILTLWTLLLFTTNSMAGNWGHRAGADVYEDLPENTLIALEASLVGIDGHPAIQYNKKFEYLEFDVQETLDGELVILHDKTIERMLPNSGKNKEVFAKLMEDKDFADRVPSKKSGWWIFSSKSKKKDFGELRIKDMKLSEIKQLFVWGTTDQKIPTLREFLEASERFQLQKPVGVEVKYLQTDKARQELLDTVAEFRDGYMKHQNIIYVDDFNLGDEANFLSFKKKFKKAFGSSSDRKFWCGEIYDMGFHGIFQCKKHSNDLCD